MNDTTAAQVAQWMTDHLEQKGRLHQSEAVREITRRFGMEFTYRNRAGNQAISRHVLRAFRELTGDSVVWDRRRRYWRKRLDSDAAGRVTPVSSDPRPAQFGSAQGGIQHRMRQRREQARTPPRPINHMTEDERRAFFADMRARTAAILARMTASHQARKAASRQRPDR